MDILFFLKERTQFIRQLHDATCAVYLRMKQQIESGEEPFVPDPNDYNESGEPAYMKEWSTAEDSIDILGQTAVSMLASSLHLYLVEWVEQDHGMGTVERYKQHNKVAFRDGGWFGGIRSFFMECRGIKWEDSGCNIGLLEEIVLCRNRAQHPEDIATLGIRYLGKQVRRVRSSFFAEGAELALLEAEDDSMAFVWRRVRVTPEKALTAIAEVERFCEWLETQRRTRSVRHCGSEESLPSS